MNSSLQVTTSKEFTDSLAQAMKGLPEHVADAFLCILRHLLSKMVVVHPVGGDVAAGQTCDRSISLRIVGAAELIAAARAAPKLE